MRDPLDGATGARRSARGHSFARPLAVTGLAAMVAGAIDPLEGAVLILAGVALAAVGAVLARSPERHRLGWALGLIGVGVVVLFGLSAAGGIGGATRLSNWWGLLLVPYPVGWVVGLVGIFRFLRDQPASRTAPEERR